MSIVAAKISLEQELKHLEGQIQSVKAALAALRGHGASFTAAEAHVPAALPRRKFKRSAAARKRISGRMKKRWAEFRKGKVKTGR